MKRFYKDVSLSDGPGGVELLLDGRKVKTPAGHVLELPKGPFAESVAEEWLAQGEEVRPETMPHTRLANTVIDGISERGDEVVASLAAYGQTDLICYEAEHPAALVESQQAVWHPVREKVSDILGAPIVATKGVTAIEQDAALAKKLEQELSALDPHVLAAVHEMTTLTGSVFLTLAVLKGVLHEDAAWDAAHVDESFQQEQWGKDEEAAARLEKRRLAFRTAAEALRLLGAID